MKFEGYLQGIPVYSDPTCPPKTLYLMRTKKPKVEVSPSYSPSYSPSPSMDDDCCGWCGSRTKKINVNINHKKTDWYLAGFQFTAGSLSLFVLAYYLMKLLEFLFK